MRLPSFIQAHSAA